MLDQTLPGIVDKSTFNLAVGLTYTSQIATAVVAVMHQHFAALVGVKPLDLADAALPGCVVCQFNLDQVKGVPKPQQATVVVIIQVDTVVVAIT